MGYIGQVPTAIPLTSADIADGTIALADIATNQIDETLMKDAFVGDFSDVTVTAADAFLYGDATDSGNTKKDTVQGILDLAGGGEDGLTNNSNTTWLTVSADEQINMPLQPSFYARRTSAMADVTGTNATYVIDVIFDVEVWDTGSNYNTTNGIFTAPITGKYMFASYVYMNGWTSSNTAATFQFNASNRISRTVQFPPLNTTSSFSVGGSVIVDMDASDTCKVESGVSGTNQGVDIYADTNASNGYTWFAGWLLG